ncbi:MAG: hypothetical protein M3O85_04950 [Acidobacteriota bacterium]|nr:hypothetical protein [Acidobacteriota bacterium]
MRTLLDLGTSNAFFTLISQRPRTRQFYLFYFGWEAVQFGLAILFIAVLPKSLFEGIWLGNSRGVVILAFFAVFLQQQLWQTVSQIGESSRKSVRVQLMNISIAVVHLGLIVLLLLLRGVSVEFVLWLLAGEYLAASSVAYWFLRGEEKSGLENGAPPFSIAEMAREYWTYCKPLVLLSFVAFLYFFGDRWLLQRFGGGRQQGYFQIASQFASVSLLATTSILSIFWKEIAEAHAEQNHARVASLYRKVFRGLLMVSAILSGLLIPWTREIVLIVLGRPYLMATPVLAIMFLYPIAQSMGQINGTMFLASGRTSTHTTLTVLGMLVSIPATYFLQAPRSDTVLPGLGLGALGMGIKMVVLGFAAVTLQSWVLARKGGWKFEWFFQLASILGVIALGYACKLVTSLIWNLSETTVTSLIGPAVFCFLLYAGLILSLVRMVPRLVGMERQEIAALSKNLWSVLAWQPAGQR